MNRSRTLDLDADYKNGDFIQFKIDFYKEGDQSTSFAGLEVEYETNPFVLKEAQSKSGKVSVSFINGKIYELLNKTTGKNYLPVDQGIMPFLIYIKDANGENIPIDENDFYPLKPELKVAKNGEQIFRIPYKGEKSNIRVDLQMTLNPNSDVIDSSIVRKSKCMFGQFWIKYKQ